MRIRIEETEEDGFYQVFFDFKKGKLIFDIIAFVLMAVFIGFIPAVFILSVNELILYAIEICKKEKHTVNE